MVKVKDPSRRVNFLPFCEVREFGMTDAESDCERMCTVESMAYAARWINQIPVEKPKNEKPNFNASLMGLAGDSPARKPQRTSIPIWRSRVLQEETAKRSVPVGKVMSHTPFKHHVMGKLTPRSPRNMQSPRRRPLMGISVVAMRRKAALKAAQQSTKKASSPGTFWNIKSDLVKMQEAQATRMEDPICRNTLFLRKLHNIRKFERDEQEEKKKELKKNGGVLWTKPTVSESARIHWHLENEMESGSETPGGSEHSSTASGHRNKRLLTVKERMARELERKREKDERKDDALKKMYCKQSLKDFIEKAKNGVSARSIASTSTDTVEFRDTSNSRFGHFEEMRTVYVRDNHREPRKIDFRVRANIARRLANPDLDRKVRIAYDVISKNYDSVLGPHLYYFFTYKKDKNFEDLERMFLLNL